MCGMYIINGVHGPETNTSSNPQVSALIPRPAFNGMERMCHSHGSNQTSHPPVLVRKPLCNQFMHYHISSRWVLVINHFKLRNFSIVVIECAFATVDKSSIMTRIHWWSVMIYGSLQAELWRPSTTVMSMGMEHLSMVKLLLKYLSILTTIVKYFGGCKIS